MIPALGAALAFVDVTASHTKREAGKAGLRTREGPGRTMKDIGWYFLASSIIGVRHICTYAAAKTVTKSTTPLRNTEHGGKAGSKVLGVGCGHDGRVGKHLRIREGRKTTKGKKERGRGKETDKRRRERWIRNRHYQSLLGREKERTVKELRSAV